MQANGFIQRLVALPFVCWLFAMGTVDVSEFKIVGMAIKIRFAGAPTFCDSREAKRLRGEVDVLRDRANFN